MISIRLLCGSVGWLLCTYRTVTFGLRPVGTYRRRTLSSVLGIIIRVNLLSPEVSELRTAIVCSGTKIEGGSCQLACKKVASLA